MLHFFPPGMPERYLLFSFLAVLGVIQLIAACYHWVGLSIPGRQRWRWGYVLGAGLLGGAYLWFFGTAQTLIFQPGLAGAELFTVFGVSTLLAIAATLGLVSLLHASSKNPPALAGQRVEFQPGSGKLTPPPEVDLARAVVLVSDLLDGDFPVSRLAEQLVSQGFLILNIDLAADGPVEYPEIFARLLAACAFVQDRPGVDDPRIVLIGAGVGGDLVLRAAATGLPVQGVAAVDPVLHSPTSGLDLLHHATFWEALRWDRLRRRLAQRLAAAEHVPQLPGRPVRLILRRNQPPDSEIAAGNADVTVVKTTDEAVQRVVQWTADVTDEHSRVA